MKKALENTVMTWAWLCAAIVLLVLFLLFAGLAVLFFFQGKQGAAIDFAALLPQILRVEGFTILSAVLGVIIAFPLSMGLCIFILYFAPGRLAGVFGNFAWGFSAVPAVVMGYLSLLYIMPVMPGPFLGLTVTLSFMAVPRLTTDFIRLMSSKKSRDLYIASACLGALPYESILHFTVGIHRRGVLHYTLRAVARAMSEGVAIMIALFYFGPQTNTLATMIMRFSGVVSEGASMQAAFIWAIALLIPLAILYITVFAVEER